MGVDISGIQNRNEVRVQHLLAEVLAQHQDYQPESLDIQDIYALALNLLPARYVQPCSIVLREPVAEDDVRVAICSAIERVRSHPNHG